ncbi:DUF4129 domain-containing protein [uncultured Pseudomonas sp.]|uniref:DUF4129 domain-containing protein n=1 Tax=uncultured Pseudomonas sp. TaxID=114707 RepID=UPI0025D6ED9B|nr:DUF4129 domain-containing protein [uncultured Pseudomonas sp.]
MQLNDAGIEIRPRPAWEALDLGVLLAREHRRLLMLSWALVTLPLLALMTALLWDYPGAVMLLFWWLKPLYERLPLLILSRALFGATPTLKQALRAWPGTLRQQWLPSLFWRRLSLIRSFTLPVQQLEGLAGEARARRLSVLCQADLNAARCLTLVGAHLETVLYTGALLLVWSFIPRQLDLDWKWLLWMGSDEQWLWADHLMNLLYALVLIVWEPIYVACGFTLYLNRRTCLEAWDIELVFRRLRQRLASTASLLLLGGALLLAQWPGNAWATTELPVQSPRLTHQPLNSEQSRQAIGELLDKPPFKNPETITGWRFPETGQPPPSEPSARSFGWWRQLAEAAGLFARLLEILLWVLAIGLMVLLAWRYRHWLRLFARPVERQAPAATAPPQQLFGLQISAASLPADILGSVQTLWPHAPREALSLLYRAMLSRLISDYRLPLREADTEGLVLERIAAHNDPALDEFSRNLTRHWQNLAYGHRLPSDETLQHLCAGWRRLFEPGAPA